MSLPDPFREIRLVSLQTVRGANFWSRSPVTRLDLAVGAYDEISSADVYGFTEALTEAFPGLVEHRCSIGERGGFIRRLQGGTYAPHIVEHLALELQEMIGHRVGYGRARGGDRPGEYSVVFAHRHAAVGLRAAAHALEAVQRAFAGQKPDVGPAIAELRWLAAQPDAPRPVGQVLCGITGSGPRREVREALIGLSGGAGEVIDLAPAYLLNAGLPYAQSRLAVALGTELADVPERYLDPELAAQLVSVVADAVGSDGFVIAPAAERELRERLRGAECRMALFSEAGPIPPDAARAADLLAWIRRERIVIECRGQIHDVGPLRNADAADVCLITALAAFVLDRTSLDTTSLDA